MAAADVPLLAQPLFQCLAADLSASFEHLLVCLPMYFIHVGVSFQPEKLSVLTAV